MAQNRRRWSGSDQHFGPFTYSASGHGLGLVLGSGAEESPGCHIRMHAFGRTLICELPPVLWPHRRRVQAGWDSETIARLGRDWYWDEHERELGATLVDAALHVRYGAQTHDSRTCRSKCWFVPWMNWRHVRSSIYGLRGEHIRTERRGEPWEEWYDARNACPSMRFEFDDFDGERIAASTRIEEMEWRFGTGGFRWLSVFRPHRIWRSLSIEFSKETGPRKGSWKGGTIGHGIEMLPGELHESAFRRYCIEHRMTFVSALLDAKAEGKEA